MRLRISTVLLSTALSVGAAFAQSSQAITGTVTDAMCGAHHMMQGKTRRNVPANALSRGLTLPLPVGTRLKGDKNQFDKFAGQNVTVKGKVDGKTITADSIAAAKP